MVVQSFAFTPDKLPIERMARQFMDKTQSPGVAIAVVYGGKTDLYFFGVMDLKTKQAISKDTIFEIGSVSKVFTSTLLGMAVAESAVNLQQPIEGSLPKVLQESSFPIDRITFEQLATHTSGLPRNPKNFVEGEPYPLTKEIVYLSHWQPPYKPGTRYSYSNLGFGVLGLCLSYIYGAPYSQLLQQKLLRPIGMKKTGLIVDESPNYAQGYLANGGKAPKWRMTAWRPAAGGIRSTLGDMAIFLRANLSNKFTPNFVNEGIKQAHKPHFTKLNGNQVGLGWEINVNKSGEKIYSKDGETAGFSAFIAFIPSKQMGVVVMANKGGVQVRHLAKALLLRLDKTGVKHKSVR